MNGRVSFTLSLASLLAVNGCAIKHSSPSGTSTFATAPLEESNLSAVVESSVQEQAQEALLKMPTEFDVPYRDDRYAWERARMFFDKYVADEPGKAPPVMTKVKKETWILTNRDHNPPRYVYEVKRIEDRRGFSYSVSCEPRTGGTRENAQMNARNLSRFIRDGSLEVSLLKR